MSRKTVAQSCLDDFGPSFQKLKWCWLSEPSEQAMCDYCELPVSITGCFHAYLKVWPNGGIIVLCPSCKKTKIDGDSGSNPQQVM